MSRCGDEPRERSGVPVTRLTSWIISVGILSAVAVAVTQQKPTFTPNQKAYYLDSSQVAFVRPGLVVKILSASIDAQGRIQARFRITDRPDPLGLPLDRTGVFTPGTVNTSFIAAVLPAGAAQYTSYTTRVQTSPITRESATQAVADSPAGTYEQVAEGEYLYTFTTRAPANFDRSATHTIGVYSSRILSDFDLGTQFDDDVFHFKPDGSPVSEFRDVVRTESCNRCHDPLRAHGGARRSVALCVLCHTPQTTDPDTGNTVDLKVMAHKIHMGADLPSVAGTPYRIIGFNQNEFDFSEVRFPADVHRCEVCHTPDASTQSRNYLLKPSRAACGACHDNVNFATGENHGKDELPQVSDNQCSTCHFPEGELEFDTSIKGAHTIPTHSKALPGVVFEILRVHDGSPGKNPTVHFSIKDRSGRPILPSEMTRLALVMSLGSAQDYPAYVSEDARSATGSDGAYMYTFRRAIPEDARGTFAVGIEGYRAVTLLAGTRKEIPNVRDAGINKVFYFAATGSTPTPRRAVVAQAKCDSCHAFLELHGSNRNQVEQCLICHNANETDTARRPADKQPPESVHFKTMIHKIHTGEELASEFTVYGFGNTPHNYNEVRFPGDRRNCSACHVNNSEQLPLKEGVLPSQSPRDLIHPKEPITAACLSCHTSRPAASHALTNTSRLGEACEACHGPNADFSINRVHAR